MVDAAIVEDHHADMRRRDLTALKSRCILHPGRHRIELFRADSATFRRCCEPSNDFGPVEGLGLTGALDHGQRGVIDSLVRGEARGAGETLPTASDRCALLGKARVDHFAVIGSACRTLHSRDGTGPDCLDQGNRTA